MTALAADANRHAPTLKAFDADGPAQRHRRVPPRLPRADDVPEAPRHRRGAVGGTRRRRARPARRPLHPVRAGRGRHAVPGHDDLRERPRAAARSGARGTLAAAGGGPRLRSALRAGVRQARRHDRHGHDREAGRVRRADQHDARGAGRRARVPHRRPQVVLLRADVRCAPDPRAGGRRPVVLPAAALHAGRARQRHPDPAAEGQARRSLERELGSRVLERARGARRRRGPRDPDDPRDGHVLPARLRAGFRGADPRCARAGGAPRAAPATRSDARSPTRR